jgi:hypothetical protein
MDYDSPYIFFRLCSVISVKGLVLSQAMSEVVKQLPPTQTSFALSMVKTPSTASLSNCGANLQTIDIQHKLTNEY